MHPFLSEGCSAQNTRVPLELTVRAATARTQPGHFVYDSTRSSCPRAAAPLRQELSVPKGNPSTAQHSTAPNPRPLPPVRRCCCCRPARVTPRPGGAELCTAASGCTRAPGSSRARAASRAPPRVRPAARRPAPPLRFVPPAVGRRAVGRR